MATDKSFFDEQLPTSRLKSEIVTKYFVTWARIIGQWQRKEKKDGRLGYLDFYCGPGRYDDNTPSTPIKILEKAVNDELIASKLSAYFSDADSSNVSRLQEHVREIPGIGSLKYPPQFGSMTVDEDLAARIERSHLPPSLIFLDPWGYKGLTNELLSAVVKDWGCDCIFFFNYSRINSALSNKDNIHNHMKALFGETLACELREQLDGKTPSEREDRIVDEFLRVLRNLNRVVCYPLAFRFKKDADRTSHHLVFLTKSEKGYLEMKEIMGKYSEVDQFGIPTFTAYKVMRPVQKEMFAPDPMEKLGIELLAHYSGKRVTGKMIQIEYGFGLPFLKKHFRIVLRRLVDEGKITPSRKPVGANSLNEDIVLTFP